MTDLTDAERDPRKVRIGLVMICLVVVIAIGLFLVVGSPLGKALMFAVAATAFVRAWLLVRWLRQTEAERGG